ncbi:MAG TPA: flagellar basal body protein [Candidatus Binataceae bacterium]|nr:flagellar basal body protein [Candidatus Binataceae bacterium]
MRNLHHDWFVRILGHDQSVMEAALKVRSMRADVLAENVANADTPNFSQHDLSFDGALQQVLDHEPAGDSLNESDIKAENLRIDRNDIDLNQQMGQVYENSLDYVATLRLYSDSIGRIRSATGNS